MELLNDEAATQWCEASGLSVSSTATRLNVRLRSPTAKQLRLTVNGTSDTVISLAYMLVAADGTLGEDVEFQGALAWLVTWDMWSPSSSDPGLLLFEGLRAVAGQHVPLDDAAAQVFHADEFVQAQACLCLPLLFQWDAYLIPRGGKLVVFVSHDGYVDIWSPDATVHEAMKTRYAAWHAKDVHV